MSGWNYLRTNGVNCTGCPQPLENPIGGGIMKDVYIEEVN